MIKVKVGVANMITPSSGSMIYGECITLVVANEPVILPVLIPKICQSHLNICI